MKETKGILSSLPEYIEQARSMNDTNVQTDHSRQVGRQ